ncbi:MAG: spore cortex-lytic enzyme [Bacillota bacterium]|jgi:N-acetylmuramoyl-L-alanine amidase
MTKRLLTFLMVLALSSLLASSAAAVGERNLYWGNTGNDVYQVQLRLIRWGYMQGGADGVYGAKTFQAVRLFQSRNGLNVTGNVDASTYRALGFSPKVGAPPAVNKTPAVASTGVTSSGDLHLLAKIIYGEARGEPLEGQVAIAAVVLNRVRSPLFPNTISGVIFEPRAFTAVADGQFYLQPDQTAYKAAQLALDGWDPTYGALYYFNPATATSPWIWSRPYIMTIGRHRFCR